MIKLDFSKLDGLVPAVAQDWQTGEVLMVAFMNEESWELTLKTGIMHYWSRSRGQALEEGRELGQHPGGEGAAHRLRRGLRPGQGPPDRGRGLPHRVPQLLLPGGGGRDASAWTACWCSIPAKVYGEKK